MGWQKTFTLSKRDKGCHLITDEVLGQIDPGLKDVQVRGDYTRPTKVLILVFAGRNAISLCVSQIASIFRWAA